jgi:3,4-dihydroxy 2-butanone 4-phosphate synthase/GTP cyclohydrolase II
MDGIDRRTALKLLGVGAAGFGGGFIGRGADAAESPQVRRPRLEGVDAAVAAVSGGEPVVLVDDAEGANQGVVMLAAEYATTGMLAFIVRHTSGLVCVGMTGDRLDALDLPLMLARHPESGGTPFTVSVDYRPATTNGISAADRAATIQALVAESAEPSDFARPGHVFPLRARPGGVLQRPGSPEAAVDLARLAGLKPAGVVADIVNDDGTMACGSQPMAFAGRHDMAAVSIGQLVAHRRRHESGT